ncbi:MAG: metal-dependent transcriptional regulator [Mogibacterium sp.]|nr:metal-dependent transcriptional regulator [Mogibacterium sp.]
MQIQKSGEDYLETMLMLKERNGYVRSIDVARHLDVSKPSVSYATKRLRENGYITMNDDGLIELTDKGMEVASKIYDRHKLLTRFLMMLGVSEDLAEDDACKIEHDISNETFEALCNHVNGFMASCPKIAANDPETPCTPE